MPANTKKRILCFGDSNTWGYVPNTNHQRYDDNFRYPKVLQTLLGAYYEVIEEGLNSRTLISDDLRPGKEGRNGSTYLIPCIDTHDPIDLIILMLGTNELKHSYEKTPAEIANCFEEYFIKVILNRKPQTKNTPPEILIVSPPKIDENFDYAKERFINGAQKSIILNDLYKKIADKYNSDFVSSIDLAVGADGVHLTKESHNELAKRLSEKINLDAK